MHDYFGAKPPTIFIACLSGITGKLKLEGISGGHLAQPVFSKQGQLDQVAHNCVQLCFLIFPRMETT